MDPSNCDNRNADGKRDATSSRDTQDEETQTVPSDASSGGFGTEHPAFAPGTPEKIGRFTIQKRLGGGQQAELYLAHDDELDRLVTLKIPRLERIRSQADLEGYVAEARNTARLNHPGIVSVYDVYTDEGMIVLVLEHIEGCDLGEAMRHECFSASRSAELMIEIAGAASYAHEQGIIHRDLKPSNILSDSAGKPYIVDFGLAIRTRGQRHLEGQLAGSPLYMSPEQTRGENHRLDRRTDIWSMGVIFYRLLTGQGPFSGETTGELFDEIRHRDVRPPRQIRPNVPRELERICLKCLAKRMTDRYWSANELVSDLRHWRQERVSRRSKGEKPSLEATVGSAHTDESMGSAYKERPVKVVPRGLRSFSADDADFFLELLPGPVDREGIPESIRFWKRRIEQTDPAETFSVGLLYGPSGCGKSSIVKAGLIPRLADHVQPIYVETSADNAPDRLARLLREVCPSLPPSDSLARLMMAIREENTSPEAKKIVVFLDQFEQWVHAMPAAEDDQLLHALRQCDGIHLQCVLMVRDDFGMSAMRFMNALEIRVVEGHNYATVDLFDEEHAAKVLGHLGRALGKLPSDGSLSDEQREFLQEAVRDLADDRRVVCVHLALFAEMFRWRTWDPVSLRAAGGAQGIGIAFLNDTLSSSAANPRRRLHRRAARRVLKALLPEHEADIRDRVVGYQELLRLSGYDSRPEQFADLVEMLDTELRLITPTDSPDGGADEDWVDAERADRPRGRRYQLTHDYLVSPLREWLTRKQRQTRHGRAQLLLEDRAALWSRRPERRHLPSLTETITIQLLTRKTDWSSSQQKMMRASKRAHAVKVALAVAMLIGIAVAGVTTRAWLRHQKMVQDVDSLVSQLLTSDVRRAPEIIDRLESYEDLWQDRLNLIAHDRERRLTDRLRAHLAMVRTNSNSIAFLLERLLGSSPDELAVIREELGPWKDRVGPKLWAVLDDPERSAGVKVRAACALAGYDPSNSRWQDAAIAVSRALLKENPLLLVGWVAQLSPVGGVLQEPLAEIFRDRSGADGDQIVAASVLALLLAEQPRALASLVKDANASQYRILLDAIVAYPEEAKLSMRSELTRATSTGPVLESILRCCKHGWPPNSSAL